MIYAFLNLQSDNFFFIILRFKMKNSIFKRKDLDNIPQSLRSKE